jgi:hypothetical protein
MSDTIERNAETQNRYREANERVAGVYNKFAASGALDTTSELFHLFCECGRQAPCGERVKVSAATYERVRSDPTTFLLFPGHEATAVEYTVERGEGFLITRNLGRAAEIARAADPRRVVDLSRGWKPTRLVF